MIHPRLLEILACPVCKAHVRVDNDFVVCEKCCRKYAIKNGIPIMLAEEQDCIGEPGEPHEKK